MLTYIMSIKLYLFRIVRINFEFKCIKSAYKKREKIKFIKLNFIHLLFDPLFD
jgi:hypothetical protein